jgi:Cu/Ag efflux pump CusA
MDKVNRPKVSRFVAGSYVAIVVFIAVIIAFFSYASFFTPMGIPGLIAFAVSVLVEAIMLSILVSIYRTKYVLTDKELIIRATNLIGGSKRIDLKDVVNVERTLIPAGVRLFGASFYGGYYYIPALGRAFLAITNFHDGILIETKRGNYIITPENPEDFVKAINAQVA